MLPLFDRGDESIPLEILLPILLRGDLVDNVLHIELTVVVAVAIGEGHKMNKKYTFGLRLRCTCFQSHVQYLLPLLTGDAVSASDQRVADSVHSISGRS